MVPAGINLWITAAGSAVPWSADAHQPFDGGDLYLQAALSLRPIDMQHQRICIDDKAGCSSNTARRMQITRNYNKDILLLISDLNQCIINFLNAILVTQLPSFRE
jgi:hypothetical protein